MTDSVPLRVSAERTGTAGAQLPESSFYQPVSERYPLRWRPQVFLPTHFLLAFWGIPRNALSSQVASTRLCAAKTIENPLPTPRGLGSYDSDRPLIARGLAVTPK